MGRSIPERPGGAPACRAPAPLACRGFGLAGMLGFAAYGVIAQWAVSVAGAAVLIFLLQKLGLFK